MSEYLTDAEPEWPARIYHMVEVSPGVYAMRDVTDEGVKHERFSA